MVDQHRVGLKGEADGRVRLIVTVAVKGKGKCECEGGRLWKGYSVRLRVGVNM